MEINYIGEHLWPGRIGNFFVILGFVGALLSTYANFSAQRTGSVDWKKIGRLSFRIHSMSIIGIAATLFYIIFNHYFEYNYAYQHSSTKLPLRYMLSCFWEGQEGSFMLWMFWHAVLGNILLKTAKNWENSVMTVLSGIQVFLSSMLLGVYVLGLKIGSSPFMLLRQNPEMMNIPVFQNPNYVQLIQGTGLNPLLQNYWMTIHPPTLFLGFASTAIPFCYAVASLWKTDFRSWIKPAIPWTFFGILILGTGVLMGGAWAYEALSFGGFWAWDPVENASLVPWLFFVGAGHLLILNKTKGDQATSLPTTYVLTLLTFLLVLYSTYLTRSGILGETSVHSFADGLPGQLIVFMMFFLIGSIVLIAYRYRSIPKPKSEEPFLSRDFWMLVASLVLVISAFQITFTTSIPVINAIFGTEMAPPINAVQHFNSWQIPFAIVVALMMAFAQYLNYKKTSGSKFYRRILPDIFISLVLSVLIILALEIQQRGLMILLFASLMTITSNTKYLVTILRGKVKKAGASIAHVGFGLVLLGSLLSAGLQETISYNSSGIDIQMKDDSTNANLENILLYKNDTLPMGPYLVSYQGKVKEGINLLYEVSYTPKKGNGNSFSLFPRIQLNKAMGNVPEPDTRHFWNKDLFTYVTYVNKQEFDENPKPDYKIVDTLVMTRGDSSVVAPNLIILKGISGEVDKVAMSLLEDDIALRATIEINDLHGNVDRINPVLVIRENKLYNVSAESKGFGIRISLISVDPATGEMMLIAEKDQNVKEDFIIMKAVIFPYINVLWMGCIIMIIGISIATYYRIKS